MNPSALSPQLSLLNSSSEQVGEPGELSPGSSGPGGLSDGAGASVCCRQRERLQWVGQHLQEWFHCGVFFVDSSSLQLWGGHCPSTRLCWVPGDGLNHLPGLGRSQQLNMEVLGFLDSGKRIFKNITSHGSTF